MTAPHFNGESHPRLKAIAAAERERFRAGQLNVPINGENPYIAPPWEHPLEASEALDFATLADHPSFTREWGIEDWFPLLETTGCGGPGGEGKTLLASQLATAHALERPWLSMPVEPMKAALVLCEDRTNDAHLRQVDINRYYGARMADLDGRLLVLPRRNKQHNYLGIFDQDGELHLTTWFDQLVKQLKAFGARMTVLDGRSDIFRGNQNDERHARMFVRKVTDRIAEETEGYCALLYQPSRAGRVDGTGEAGSSQWDAAFRARGVLLPAEPDDDPATRRLVRKKSNFAAKGTEIEIRWHNGVFVSAEELDAARPAYELAAERSKGERVFLALLRQFTQQQRRVSASPTAGNYAPKEFAKEPGAEGCKQSAFESAMRTLLAQHVVANEPYGPPSKAQMRLVQVV